MSKGLFNSIRKADEVMRKKEKRDTKIIIVLMVISFVSSVFAFAFAIYALIIK